MSSFRKFKKPPVTIGKPTEEWIVQNILNLVKKDDTQTALSCAIKTMDKHQMVDFAIEVIGQRYKIYRLGVENLKETISKHRAGNTMAIKKYMEEQKDSSAFKFSPFTSACLNVLKVEEVTDLPKDVAADFIMISLMSLPTEVEENQYKDIHMKLISSIMSFKFNNNTMKVLYGV